MARNEILALALVLAMVLAEPVPRVAPGGLLVAVPVEPVPVVETLVLVEVLVQLQEDFPPVGFLPPRTLLGAHSERSTHEEGRLRRR